MSDCKDCNCCKKTAFDAERVNCENIHKELVKALERINTLELRIQSLESPNNNLTNTTNISYTC